MGGVVTIMVIIGKGLGSGLRILSRRAQRQLGKATAIASESISNVRTIRAFSMEEKATEAYKKEVVRTEELAIDLGYGIGFFQSAMNLAVNGLVLGTLLFGGFLMANNEINAGNLMSFLVATQNMQRSQAQLSLLYGQYMKAVISGSWVITNN